MISKKDFQIGGFQKLSLLDYPGKVAAIVFTNGCNFRCPFCHNYEIASNSNNKDLFENQDILDYLIKRKKLLDGLVITGGEPTIQIGLEEFINNVKSKTNLLIKLDTNGSNPEKLKKIIDNKLIDYVAMDIKNDFDDYENITGIKKINTEKIKESFKIIKNSKIEHEFRTTVVKDFHTYKKLENIARCVGNDSKYFIQQFIISENVPNKELHPYSDEELLDMKNRLKMNFPNVEIRGIKIDC